MSKLREEILLRIVWGFSTAMWLVIFVYMYKHVRLV